MIENRVFSILHKKLQHCSWGFLGCYIFIIRVKMEVAWSCGPTTSLLSITTHKIAI